MWFGTGKQGTSGPSAGISRMIVSSETGESEWTFYKFDDFQSVNHLFEARDATVWVDLGGTGPTAGRKRRFLNGKWETVDCPHNTAGPPAQTQDGSIWFGSKGGVVRFEGVGWTFIGPENGLERAVPNQNYVFADQDGNLWVSHVLGGASRFDGAD
jgi:hypothetical protein